MLWFVSIKPSESFHDLPLPEKPDYASINSWAAHPDLQDTTDRFPNIDTVQMEREVDVFFVHPTTLYSPDVWNQSLDDQKVNTLTDNWVGLNQASVFNRCCRIFMPRYRQATLFSIITDHPDGDLAKELAYGDVVEAFKYFLAHENQGRPFIIASHSQGSWHALRLIEEELVTSRARDRLVAAYLVGMPLPKDKFERTLGAISLCQHELATGCIVTWNSVLASADSSFYREGARVWYEGLGYEENNGKSLACINPLSWKTVGRASPEENLGGVSFRQDPNLRPKPDIALVGAQCVDGMLHVSKPDASGYDWFLFGEGNYHMHDYDLFYMNIQQNVTERIRNFIQP